MPHKKDQALLELIQSTWGGVGKITKQREDSIQYRVSSVKDLQVIIDHFDKHPLITQKRADYELFKQALELIQNKEHLTNEGIQKIVRIKVSMNLGLSDSLKVLFPNVIPVPRPIDKEQEIPGPHWIVGFVEGEGCFFVKILKSSKIESRYQVIVGFQITQHSRDAWLINSMVTFFVVV